MIRSRINEISMLSGDVLHKIDCTARACRQRPHVSFGGVQILLLGDFAQLPPVTRHRAVYDFCFLSPCWRELRLGLVLLTRVFCQNDDPQFTDILAQMRFGRMSPSSCAALRGRVQHSTHAIAPTKMCPRNTDVDHENERCLRMLSGESHVYTSRDSGTDAGALRALQSSCPAAASIELKVGALVVFLFCVKLT